MSEIIITAATQNQHRRFLDMSPEYMNGRNVAFRPGAGECRIRQSFDGGNSFDVIETITGQNRGGKIETYKRRLELECTGNAVIVLSL